MFGSKLTIVMFLILITILGTSGTIGYFYYKKSQETILQLQSNNSKLEVAVNELSQTITSLEKNYQSANTVIKELNDTLSATRVRNRELADRLAKHDLNMLALEKPKLVEKIINNASAEALRCFELLSGAPLNEKEKNAKTEKGFNSECSYLFYVYRSNP